MQTQQSAAETRIPRLWPFKRFYYGWAVVGAALVASFGQAPVFGPVLGVFITPIQAALGWDRTVISFAFTIGTLTGSAMTFLFGRLLDKYGSRVIVVITGLLIAGSLLAMSAMTQPWQLWIAFGIGRGSALAGIQVGTSIAIANWFFRKRGRAIAIRGVGQRAGQAIVPLFILAVMSTAGWRWAFVALSGFAVVTIALPAALYLRRRPEDMGLLPDGERAEQKDVQPSEQRRARVARGGGEVSFTLQEVRHTRAFWALIVYSTVNRFALGSVNLHMVANFQDKGLSDAQAVSILSLFAAVSAITVVPWGLMLERLHVRYGAMMVATLFVGCMAIILIANTYPLAIVFGLVFGFAVGGSTILENLIFANYFGRAHLGAIRGFGAPFRMISPFGPVFAGYLYDKTHSYNVAFFVFMGMFAVMFIAMLVATPPKKVETAEAA